MRLLRLWRMSLMGDFGSDNQEIEVFYDGGCPLCLREMNFLRRRNGDGGIRFTDIDAPGFQAPEPGPSREQLMAQIHARLRDGTWIQGVEVFRRMYTAAGFGPLVRLTRLPVIAQLLGWGYAVFARNRLRLTGRCADRGCCALPQPVPPPRDSR